MMSRRRGALGHPVVAAGGVELGIQIRFAQAGVVQVEHPRPRTLQQTQRIDVRDQMAAIAVDLHQPRDRGLLFARHRRRLERLARPRRAAWVRAATAAMTGLCALLGHGRCRQRVEIARARPDRRCRDCAGTARTAPRRRWHWHPKAECPPAAQARMGAWDDLGKPRKKTCQLNDLEGSDAT